MKKFSILALLSFMMIFANAQDGIKFSKGSWADVTKEAKKAKKLIFIDCYTEWCGPCKQMEKNIFPLKKVGDFFNKSFINYKVDMEKGEGIELKDKFHVGAFPTLLWVDHKGNVVHKIVGGRNADQLIAEGENALAGGNINTDLEKKYKKNKNNLAIVKEYFNHLNKTYDARAKDVAKHYLSILPKEKYLEKENWEMIARQVQTPFSPIIEYIYANRVKFEEKFTPQAVEMMLHGKYFNYANKLAYAVKDGKDFDEMEFQRLIQLMDERKFESKNRVIESTRLNILKLKKDWKAYIAKIESLVASGYYKHLDDFQTYYRWYMPIASSNTTDVEVLKKAISWIDKANELNDFFRMFYFKMYWETKIKLYERLGDDYRDVVSRLKTELEFIKYLEGKQSQYDKKLREENKVSGKDKKTRGIPAMRMR